MERVPPGAEPATGQVREDTEVDEPTLQRTARSTGTAAGERRSSPYAGWPVADAGGGPPAPGPRA